MLYNLFIGYLGNKKDGNVHQYLINRTLLSVEKAIKHLLLPFGIDVTSFPVTFDRFIHHTAAGDFDSSREREREREIDRQSVSTPKNSYYIDLSLGD